MIRVYTWDEAPEELKALSDHGGDEEHVIVGSGEGLLPEIMKMREMFDTIVMALDVWSGGSDIEHKTQFEGEPVIVYITAHA